MMNWKRKVAIFMVIVLILPLILTDQTEAKKKVTKSKPSISKKLTVVKGKKKTLKIKKVKSSKIKKTSWKTSNKKLKLSKKKKTSVVLQAKSVVKSKIKVTAKVILKTGKKYTLKCNVTVKAEKKVHPTPVPDTPVPNIPDTPNIPAQPTATPDTREFPEAAAVPVPAKPQSNSAFTDMVSENSKYDLTEALAADSVYEAYSKYFSIGAAINGTSPGTSTAAAPEMRQVMKRHFNSTTLSNLMKPEYILDEEGCKANAAAGKNDTPALKFNSIVDNLDFCQAAGIKMRGHVLVWHAQTPDWFFKEGFDSNAKFVDKATMKKRMGSYIRQVLEFCQKYYPGVIYCWDVVNEAADDNSGVYRKNSNWYKTIGGEFVKCAFYYARKYADPEVKLFYNDYNTFISGKRARIIALTQELINLKLIDGIGMQAYIGYEGEYPELSEISDTVTRFGKLGLEVQLTELTYRVPDYNNVTEADYTQQGKNYEELMKMLVKLDKASGGPAEITNVTFFGLMDEPYYIFGMNKTPDRDCWARLFDRNLKMKPAYYGVMNAVK